MPDFNKMENFSVI